MNEKELVEKLAAERNGTHVNNASTRPLSKGYESVGISGEIAFAKFSGLMFNISDKPQGDNGIDFVIPLFFTVDVKAARNPKELLHEVGKFIADIYVLAEYSEETGRSELLGWEFGRILKATTPELSAHGVTNYHIPQGELRKMPELAERIARFKTMITI